MSYLNAINFIFREKGWNIKESLLMDGGHENLEINLRKVMFWPDNILDLFARSALKHFIRNF